LLELVLITVAFLCVVSVIRSQAAVRVLCSLLVLASSTCVWGPAARAIYPRAQLIQATNATPDQLAQIVSAVSSSSQCYIFQMIFFGPAICFVHGLRGYDPI
jgi:hypothetical protein